ncbi:1152_t:CDS:2 [Acaulospora colombiana]|uniref:1152_t:CDS:1 n=1 Tax=Acaulospora colombiana TaxID=27376 RepID=A0ACA9LU08_9GLOM|nr:1152_t:CDS:2 [Acaulospora colombiana]
MTTTKSDFLNGQGDYALNETDTSEDGFLSTPNGFCRRSNSSTSSREYDSDSNSKSSDWPEYDSGSTSEVESEYSSYNVKKTRHQENQLNSSSSSESDSDTSRGSSTITDDSFSTIIGDTSQDEDVRTNEDEQYDSLDEYSSWMPDVSSGQPGMGHRLRALVIPEGGRPKHPKCLIKDMEILGRTVVKNKKRLRFAKNIACQLKINTDRQDSGDKGIDGDVLLRSRSNSDQNHKSRIIAKKRLRNALTFVPLTSEKRHSTATELHKLFYENYPISKVNFDDIFKPEDWGRNESTSRNVIVMHDTNTELSEKSFNQIKNSNGIIPRKIVVVNKSPLSSGKNSINLNRHGSSLSKSSTMTNGNKAISNELNVKVITNNNVTPTKSPSTTSMSTICSKRPASPTCKELSSSDESLPSPTRKITTPNRNLSLREIVDYAPKIVTTPNKSVGTVDHDEDFNIVSLLPRNLIPCINFGTLAFREGTIDPKRGQVKRGRVFSVVK